MSELHPLILGAAARKCFLIKEDALVQDGGTGPVLTNLVSGQQVRCHRESTIGAQFALHYTHRIVTDGTYMQVCKFDDQEPISTCGQASSVVSVNVRQNVVVFGLSASPSRLQLAFLSSTPQFVAIQQQRPAVNCAYSSAALSADGKHLLAFSGPAQPYLELWSLLPLQPLLAVDIEPQDYGIAGQLSLAVQ